MSTNRRLGLKSGILHILVTMMIVMSGFAIGMPKEKGNGGEEEIILDIVQISGDDEVLTHTLSIWEVQITVFNPHEWKFEEIMVTTTLPAEIECTSHTLAQGELEISKHGKGESGSKGLEWEIGTLEEESEAVLTLSLSTTLNPAGKQEFTSPGEYIIIEGASLKGIDSSTGKKISVGPTAPITVVALDEDSEDPDDPGDPGPVDPDEPTDPEEPSDPNNPDDEERKEPVKIDVLFLIDSTGSMGDEIEVVKLKIEEIIFEVQNGTPKPEVRYAILTYRDRGDAYITKLFDFTKDVEALKEFLWDIQARGGGDGPESVNEALHVALHDCSWGVQDHVKMIFLIGDAPPHMNYEVDYDYRNEVEVAHEKDITINVIGCSGIKGYSNGESIFKEIAGKTGGIYQELIYTEGSYYSRYGDSSESSLYSVNRTSVPEITAPIWDEEVKCCCIPDMPLCPVGEDYEYLPIFDWSVIELETADWDDDFVLFSCCDAYEDAEYTVSAGSSPSIKDSNSCNNILDIQITYTIQQIAIQNGVTYENAVSIPTA